MKCVEGFFKRIISETLYPFIECILVIEGEEKGSLELLVDTGAGTTSISYRDALRLNLTRLAHKKPRRKVIGATGVAPERIIEGNIILRLVGTRGDTIDVKINALSVAEPPRQRGPDYNLALQRPSVLGWDALKNLKVEIDYKNKTVRLCLTTP